MQPTCWGKGPVCISDTTSYLVKSRNREIGGLNYPIALKFGKHLNNSAAEVSVKFQSDQII